MFGVQFEQVVSGIKGPSGWVRMPVLSIAIGHHLGSLKIFK